MLEIPEEQTIRGLKFICTCEACPEQYDVFDGDKQVGYVRERHGKLRADYPDVGGVVIYEHDLNSGGFETQEEREYHLTKIAGQIIIKK